MTTLPSDGRPVEIGRAFDIPNNWTFETNAVVRGFDRHVREQLPWYDLVTGAVAHLARHYLPEDGVVYDLGAATGNIERALAPLLTDRRARLIAIDRSQAMADAYQGGGEYLCLDVATLEEFEPFDVAVLFLVVMFIPPAARLRLFRRLHAALRPGGAVILVDKVEAPAGYLGTVLHRLTLAGKVANGVPPEEIIAKELSLAGVQRPLAPAQVLQAWPDAVEFFRFGEFAGWLCPA